VRILVTGGRGQLGRELAARAGEHEIVPIDIDECDITDEAALVLTLDSVRPDAVINAAAWTKVDLAETEEAAAARINADAPALLARHTAARGLPLLQVSTDFVFGDPTVREPLPESATPSPLSAYGRTKLAGEEAVRRLNPRHQVVRTSWLYGQEGPNFVLTMLRLADRGGPIRVVADQWGSPTWTGHLAPALLRLVERGDPGLYHLTGGGATTWHAFAAHALACAGKDVDVVPITTDEYPTPARRPQYSVLANDAWRALGEAPLPDWREGVAAYVAERVPAAGTR
jgi:dTDP-4-dehydrorhamnose reductase